jgi:predicted acylesterase/phospholipase RssA
MSVHKLLTYTTTLLLSALITPALSKSPDGKCRALALRGGGSKGAYEVGFLKAMTKNLDPIEYRYDVVVGVSVGALNAALLAIYEPGNETAAVTEIEELWRSHLPQDFWTTWPYVNFFGGVYYASFLDSTPIHDEIHRHLDNRTFKRKIAIQSVDLNTGKVIIFDENTPDDIRSEAVASSASIPGMFSPTLINGMTLVDGGVFTNLDLGEAIVRCREEVENDEDIIVDIVLCFDQPVKIPEWTPEEAKWKNAYQFYERKSAFRDYYFWYYEDVIRVIRGYPHIKFRYLVTPSQTLPSEYFPIFATNE